MDTALLCLKSFNAKPQRTLRKRDVYSVFLRVLGVLCGLAFNLFESLSAIFMRIFKHFCLKNPINTALMPLKGLQI
jgi:hypothetical protein